MKACYSAGLYSSIFNQTSVKLSFIYFHQVNSSMLSTCQLVLKSCHLCLSLMLALLKFRSSTKPPAGWMLLPSAAQPFFFFCFSCMYPYLQAFLLISNWDEMFSKMCFESEGMSCFAHCLPVKCKLGSKYARHVALLCHIGVLLARLNIEWNHGSGSMSIANLQ